MIGGIMHTHTHTTNKYSLIYLRALLNQKNLDGNTIRVKKKTRINSP